MVITELHNSTTPLLALGYLFGAQSMWTYNEAVTELVACT